MNESFYRITLDIKSIQAQISLPIKQGDTSRGIYISLTDGGKPYIIADKCFAVFKGNKSDGTEVGNNCYIENNRIVYPITEQTVTSPGIVECEVSLYNSAGGLITSPRFTLIVDSRAVGSDKYKSSYEYMVLEEYLSSISAAEETRQETFEENEANRASVFEDNEAERQRYYEQEIQNFVKAITDATTDDELYSHYNVDKQAYPYVFIVGDGSEIVTYFAPDCHLNENDKLCIKNYKCYTLDYSLTSLPSTKCKDVCDFVLSNNDYWYGGQSGEKRFSNTNYIYSNYRLPSTWANAYLIPSVPSMQKLMEMAENIDNKATSVNEYTNNHKNYPSVKLMTEYVTNSLSEAIGGIENGSY